MRDSIDDTHSRIGLLSKIAYLMRESLPRLEESRIIWYPSNSSDMLQGYKYKEAIDIISNNKVELQSTLFISFSGGAIRIGGYSRFELRRTLQSVNIKHAFDMLFLLDPTGFSWYTYDRNGEFNGWQQLGHNLQNIAKHYKNVILLGNCMGGTAALIYTKYILEIGNCNCVSLIFNPQTDPTSHLDKKYVFGAKLLPFDKRKAFLVESKNIINKLSHDKISGIAKLCIHCSNDEKELQQAKLLQIVSIQDLSCKLDIDTIYNIIYDNGNQVNSHLFIHTDFTKHGIMKYLRDEADLQRLIEMHVSALSRL